MTDGCCPECGATLPDSGRCWDRVHQLLEVEAQALQDSTDGRRAHFYAIATYQLQHPSRLTAPAVAELRVQLARMLTAEVPIAELREDVRRNVRGLKVTNPAPTDISHVDSRWPRRWMITAADVVARPPTEYMVAVRDWADATRETLNAALGA
ncbi:hypothetical protein FZI91_19500 [Mycobacterium sp. CBMA271]|uniref:DUF5946 family protein n=1 Tax=unclassified Mycobacteroides TaxID=2618759 RepID=UPI0012DDDAEC|nr:MULTISPECIES: DUF5946 family protein [unclassified Mycobacteroides]MUM17295.1 hypothetical protein [Mycobacteroides sp. CBMA 326]MUM23870.1 hypothetical protein [Mycobacteroides sp. CBMA 271]